MSRGERVCRCGSSESDHLPPADGGCRQCPCPGFALTAREELDMHRAYCAGCKPPVPGEQR